MIGTIRKHQTWLWVVIITFTVISFVYYFSPLQKMENGRGPANYGSINGEHITQDDFAKAWREVELQYFIRSGGNWPNESARSQGFDQERETYQWLLLAQKQSQMGIHISSALAAQTARGMLAQFQRQEPITPQIFRQQVLEPRGLQIDDFDRFVRHYLGIQELIAAIGLGGKLVTPQEARALYIREHEELAADAVFFAATNYLAGVAVAPAAVSEYYSNHVSAYQIPARVQVSYVKFGVSNYLSQAESDLKTNLTEMVETNMQRLGTNYLRFGKTPDEAKTKIREEIIRDRALAAARRKAAEFARPLFETEPLLAGNLDALARSNALNVSVTAPFDREEGPKEFEVGDDFTKAAFARTPEDPFAPPLVGKDGVYVIAYHKKIPSETPALDQIREKVAADYKHAQAISKARTEGAAFAQTAAAGLAQGKTLAALCADAKLKVVSLPPFSLSTRPGAQEFSEVEEHLGLDQLKRLGFSTPPGKVSNFQATSEGGLILHVKSKAPPGETKIFADLPSFSHYLRQSRQQEAFNQWFAKEADRGLRDTPIAQRKQGQNAPTPSRPRKS